MASKGGLGPREAQLFAIILKNMKNRPEVDWDTVAKQYGSTSAHSVSTRYGQIMKKLALENPEVGAAVQAAQKPKGTPKPRKSSESNVGSGTNLNAMRISKPSVGGAAKARGKKEKVVKSAIVDLEMGEDDESELERRKEQSRAMMATVEDEYETGPYWADEV